MEETTRRNRYKYTVHRGTGRREEGGKTPEAGVGGETNHGERQVAGKTRRRDGVSFSMTSTFLPLFRNIQGLVNVRCVPTIGVNGRVNGNGPRCGPALT